MSLSRARSSLKEFYIVRINTQILPISANRLGISDIYNVSGFWIFNILFGSDKKKF
jgi:hypothetical protein